jgi:hypothetical protein
LAGRPGHAPAGQRTAASPFLWTLLECLPGAEEARGGRGPACCFSSASGRRLISQTMPEQLGSADKKNMRNGPARLPKVSRCPDHRQFPRGPCSNQKNSGLSQPLGCSRTLPSARFLRRTCQLTHSRTCRFIAPLSRVWANLPFADVRSTLRGFSAVPCCAPCSNLATALGNIFHRSPLWSSEVPPKIPLKFHLCPPYPPLSH